jgi:hypothetical protein
MRGAITMIAPRGCGFTIFGNNFFLWRRFFYNTFSDKAGKQILCLLS